MSARPGSCRGALQVRPSSSLWTDQTAKLSRVCGTRTRPARGPLVACTGAAFPTTTSWPQRPRVPGAAGATTAKADQVFPPSSDRFATRSVREKSPQSGHRASANARNAPDAKRSRLGIFVHA